jgi:hypothetical protein
MKNTTYRVIALLLIVCLTIPPVFAKEKVVELTGSSLAGCSFLEKSIKGSSNFREREYEFTDSSLYVTNHKTNCYTCYSYQVSGNYITFRKTSGMEDFFPQSSIRFALASDTKLSKYQLILYYDNGKSLTLLEEESLRKTASDTGLISGVAGVVVVATGVVFYYSYLLKYGYPTAAEYTRMNLDQDFLKYIGESNGARLASNLQKAGISRPLDSAAHHIVSKKDVVGNATVARQILSEVKLDLDNPANGVFLPTDKEFASISGMACHSVEEYMHKSGFMSGLTERLLRARGSKSLVLEVLSDARSLLLKGQSW